LKSAPVARDAWRIAPVTAGVEAVCSMFIVAFAALRFADSSQILATAGTEANS
jgi:hypothetical protein